MTVEPSKELKKLDIKDDSKDVPSSSQSQSQEQRLEKKDLDRLFKSFKHASTHPIDQIIRNPNQGMMTRVSFQQYCNNVAFISKVEPTCID